jgi:hypothetical protein
MCNTRNTFRESSFPKKKKKKKGGGVNKETSHKALKEKVQGEAYLK